MPAIEQDNMSRSPTLRAQSDENGKQEIPAEPLTKVPTVEDTVAPLPAQAVPLSRPMSRPRSASTPMRYFPLHDEHVLYRYDTHMSRASRALHPTQSNLSRVSTYSIASPKVSHWAVVRSHTLITPAVLRHHYPGSGTEDDPYLCEFVHDDPRNPMNFTPVQRWTVTLLNAMAALAVAFVSSAYTGALPQIMKEFHASSEVATLGLSLFVVGFAVGPLIWAPMSELYGRQYLLFGTYAMLTLFNATAAASQNIWTLIILRFFAGAFGSSPLTNAGGVVADMFPANQRGLGMSVFAVAPFLGPAIGPIVGGFAGQSIGWRWVEGIMAIFTGVIWLVCAFLVPETYAPLILRKRAAALSKLKGQHFISILEKRRGKTTPAKAFKTALSRPWALLFVEPIVFLISIYMAIIYGTLYLLFGAFPIVYQEYRGWNQGVGGLAFIGVAAGMTIGVFYSMWDNKRYARVEEKAGGEAPPEARLPPAMVGAVAIPVGMFWFAWTNGPSIHWIVSIIASAPFGFGIVVVFLSAINYLIDSYTVYAASVLAANSVLRSLFGAAFPLFTDQMFANLGIHWASSIPAFLALACVPFPFLFYKYGEPIRMRCKYSAQAHEILEEMKNAAHDVEEADPRDDASSDSADDGPHDHSEKTSTTPSVNGDSSNHGEK